MICLNPLQSGAVVATLPVRWQPIWVADMSQSPSERGSGRDVLQQQVAQHP
jgi:hypothetical protein